LLQETLNDLLGLGIFGADGHVSRPYLSKMYVWYCKSSQTNSYNPFFHLLVVALAEKDGVAHFQRQGIQKRKCVRDMVQVYMSE
jgi:hypothetical protein